MPVHKGLTFYVGKRYGRLVVVSVSDKRSQRNRTVLDCKCDCGAVHSAELSSIASGNCKSCGCLQREKASRRLKTHGCSTVKNVTPEYRAWCSMKARCSNSRDRFYYLYGGRGITVSTEWNGEGGFERFLAHVGKKPSSRHSLDRIDFNGNYEPGNVRWATATEQARNRSSCVLITIGNETKCATEWSLASGVHPKSIMRRIHSGWSPVDAVFKKAVTGTNQYNGGMT